MGYALHADPQSQQATINLFADMRQPARCRPGSSPRRPGQIRTPPSSTITSPAAGSSFTVGVPLAVTAQRPTRWPGGRVEVSVDNGATWHPTSGAANN
jgi:hypothetical protein